MDYYKARKMAKVIAIILVIAMIITSFAFIFFIPSMSGMEGSVVYAATASEEVYLDKQEQGLEDLMKYIKENYKDEVSYETLVNGAFKGVTDSLKDPYSIYYGATNEDEKFIEEVSGEFYGIGLSLEDYNGQCKVVAPFVGTPAEKAGIKSGDIITKVNNVDVTSKTVQEAADLMRGKVGTTVSVTINRGGIIVNFNLVREKIKLVSVNYRMLDKSIGYLQLTSFDNDSDTEFSKAEAALIAKGAKSLVIDIRNNTGGYIEVCAEIANQLIPAGPISHFEQKGKIIETISADGSGKTKLPIVLLINEGSASASEILAGALQDSHTAVLVGTTTYGKGVAQQIPVFGDGTSLKLSTFYFLTPNKTRIDKMGIIPDYFVQNSTGIDTEVLTEYYAKMAPMSEKIKPKAGTVGLNVFGAQQRLALLGYGVDATGTMNAKTVSAVTEFQKESGLAGYGVLDYTTMNTLEKSVLQFITGVKGDKDLQLEKAIDLLN